MSIIEEHLQIVYKTSTLAEKHFENKDTATKEVEELSSAIMGVMRELLSGLPPISTVMNRYIFIEEGKISLSVEIPHEMFKNAKNTLMNGPAVNN